MPNGVTFSPPQPPAPLTNVLTDTHIFVGDAANVPQDVALTLNATGGAFALANTGVLTMPNADSVTRGLLTAADWVTFNNKQNAIPDWTTGFGSGTQATSTWTATNAATNVNAAIIPKGTGAIVAQIPDGTFVGGNARGQYSVDFQRTRNNAAQVASGNGYSTILNGNRNTASNNYSAVLGGEQHNASGQYTIIGGGISNTASQSYASIFNGNSNTANATFAGVFAGYINTASGYASFVGCGQSNTASGSHSIVGGGQSNTASGNGSAVVGGYGNTASGYASSALGGERNTASGSYSSTIGGFYSVSNLHGQTSHASGRFSADGDAQAHELILRRAITGTAITELFLDGSSVAAILPTTNSVWHGTIEIIAICTNAGGGTTIVGDVAAASYLTTIKRIGANTALVGGVQQIGVTNADASMNTSVFTIDANNTNESLRIQFTAPATANATTQIRVVATFRGTQIKY